MRTPSRPFHALVPASRALLAGLLAAAVAGCASGPATNSRDVAPRSAPLALADCLDPDRARSWATLGNDELLVDAGRRYYHITLAYGCPELHSAMGLQFLSGGGIGRLCGGPSDAVRPLGSPRETRACPVTSLRMIDAQRYRELLDGGSATVRGSLAPEGG